MRLATLISWLVTASLGGFMLHTWLARDGLRRARATAGGLPPQLVLGHAAAAITGLLIWAAFLASGVRPLAWTAVALLMVAVGLGLCTVTLWTPYPVRKPGERGAAAAPDAPSQAAAPDAPRQREQGQQGQQSQQDQQDQPPEFTVTDEMIARLLANPVPPRRPAPIRPNPAVLIPVAHGFAAIGTFLLAVLSAIT